MHASENRFRTLSSSFLLAALALTPLLAAGCGEQASKAVSQAESATNQVAQGAAGAVKKTGEAVADTTKKAADAVADTTKKAVEGTKAAAQAASAKVESAATQAVDATKEAAAKSVDAAKTIAEKGLGAAKADTAAADATKAALAAQAAKAAEEARAKEHDHDHEKEKLAAENPVNERELKARMAEFQSQGLSEADARTKALDEMKGKLAATNPNDPSAQDTDPNSKAKLVYEFGSDTKAFGKVMQGDVLKHKFKMQSDGEQDLVIKQAKPTCGCTVANILVEEGGQFVPYQYGKPIAPGKKIEIDAELHTVNKRGHASSKINITSNDPRGQTFLSLEAEVEPFFNISPPSINFNTMAAKDTATDKFMLSTTKGDRIKLTVPRETMPQGLKIDVNPLDADADGKATRFEIVVTAGPGLVEGNLAYSVRMLSDMPIPGGDKLPNGQMPMYETQASVVARVTGAISFNPQFISLGLIRPGQTLSRTIRVTSHDPAFKITDPKVSIQGRDTVEWEFAKYFTWTPRAVPGENAVDVEVTLNGMPETLAGSFSGMLVVETGHPERGEIKALISGVCRGGATGDAPVPAPVPQPVPVPTPPK